MVDLATIVEDFFYSLHGIGLTAILVIVPMLIAIPLGFLLAIVRVRRVPVASQATRVYVSFMRGTPIIVQIFLIYNSLPLAIHGLLTSLGVQINVWDIPNLTYAITAFSLSEIAILEEVFRAAINGVDVGQVEAAECCGLTTAQAYTHIIVPQAFTAAIPVLANSVTSLIKTTSLAFSMAISDVTGLAKIQGAASSDYFDAYLAVFFVYMILVVATEQAFGLVERRHNRKYGLAASGRGGSGGGRAGGLRGLGSRRTRALEPAAGIATMSAVAGERAQAQVMTIQAAGAVNA